ncbi:hypothetical protein AABB24_025905 [Solanum stoloniferum]|uniref:TBCC domain-containing protein 1 n=1 Tax=Solanum stoloniferum TaxID=62892 RepID=A0ABD2SCH8_9SOLN
MPSQSDEEAHQLSYLQKHLGNILSLLSESVEGDGEESLVLSAEKFEHLGFIFYFGEKGSEKILLSQNAPFFANSDPNMPAVPVPAAQLHDWLLQNIASTLEHITERASAKENGPTSAPDQDVPMADVSASTVKNSSSPRGPNFIEGISKTSYVRKPNDLKGSSVKAVRVEHCERVHVIAAAKRICIANCRECVFFLGVNQAPLVVGDNHKLQVAPYNTFYPQLEEHLNGVGIDQQSTNGMNPWLLVLLIPMIHCHILQVSLMCRLNLPAV